MRAYSERGQIARCFRSIFLANHVRALTPLGVVEIPTRGGSGGREKRGRHAEDLLPNSADLPRGTASHERARAKLGDFAHLDPVDERRAVRGNFKTFSVCPEQPVDRGRHLDTIPRLRGTAWRRNFERVPRCAARRPRFEVDCADQGCAATSTLHRRTEWISLINSLHMCFEQNMERATQQAIAADGLLAAWPALPATCGATAAAEWHVGRSASRSDRSVLNRGR